MSGEVLGFESEHEREVFLSHTQDGIFIIKSINESIFNIRNRVERSDSFWIDEGANEFRSAFLSNVLNIIKVNESLLNCFFKLTENMSVGEQSNKSDGLDLQDCFLE